MKFSTLAVLALAVVSTQAIKLNEVPLGEAAGEAKRQADNQKEFAEGLAKAKAKMNAAIANANAAEEDYQRRALPDGHVHTMDGLDIDPVHGTDANPIKN